MKKQEVYMDPVSVKPLDFDSPDNWGRLMPVVGKEEKDEKAVQKEAPTEAPTEAPKEGAKKAGKAEKKEAGAKKAGKEEEEEKKKQWIYRNARPHEHWPSLFCWSHIEENGNERALLSSQLHSNFGIFKCNDFCVISRSRQPIVLGPHPTNKSLVVKTWVNNLPPDAKGNVFAGDATSSYKNAFTFRTAWRTLLDSKVLWRHDWTVKVDPDAVFYPERLRWHVAKYTKPPHGPGPFYLLNCAIGGGKLYGALEVVSLLALKELDKRGSECDPMPLDHWGEDLYLEKCLDHLVGTQNAIRDYQLVGDSRCTGGACTDGYRAAFHPMPDVGSYWACVSAGR